jgi:hypothetical protein
MPIVPLNPRLINEITQNDFERNKEMLKGIQCYLTGTIILRRIDTELNLYINNGTIQSYNQSDIKSIRIRNNTKCQIIEIEKYSDYDNYDDNYNEYNYSYNNNYYYDDIYNDKQILRLRVSFDWDEDKTLAFAAVYNIQNDTFKLLIPGGSEAADSNAANSNAGSKFSTREQERGRVRYGEYEYTVFFAGAAPYLSVDYRHNVLPRSEIYDAPGRDLGRR